MKGDIAEQAVIFAALKRNWNVLQPIGDRLPYDLVLEVNNKFIKIQVKSAWFDNKTENWVIDNRRCKTNRRKMIQETYRKSDFDFAIAYLDELEVFYIFPIDVFTSYSGPIHMVEAEKRQRKPRSSNYRESWDLIQNRAYQEEIPDRISIKFGETADVAIPSQA